MNTPTDIELLDRSLLGDRDAFGQIVLRYQTLVCSIAYSAVGDFSRSEDIGQEAFVAAWKQLRELRDRTKFKSWICAITRNLAAAAVRSNKNIRPLHEARSPTATDPSPPDVAATDEEETLVWSALENLPADYREPLVLYYRQDHSVADVAAALGLSSGAVKQRLARGRAMLREEVAAVIERSLKRTVPAAAFTAAVLGALPGVGVSTASAAAIGAAGKVSPVVAAAVKSGLFASIGGSLIGLAGGLFGTWVSWKNAQYQSERNLIVRQSIIFLISLAIFAVPFAAMAFGWQPWEHGQVIYALVLMGWMIAWCVWILFWILRVQHRWKHVVSAASSSGEPKLASSARTSNWAQHWKGRRWTSRWRLGGLPLVQIAFSDPISPHNASQERKQKRRIARGWIAIGDHAYGILLAAGNLAVGGVAVGTLSIGLFALGAIPIGGIAVGGCALGLFALGGLAVGVFPAGGLALGWAACGGLAIGWLAFGGMAVAWRAASGGMAVAHDYAVGGVANAKFANDATANEFLASSIFFQQSDTYLQIAERMNPWQNPWLLAALILTIVVPILLERRICYCRSDSSPKD